MGGETLVAQVFLSLWSMSGGMVSYITLFYAYASRGDYECI